MIGNQDDLDLAAKQAMYDWQYRGETATNFSVQLIRLIAKADLVNKFRIELGFPEFVKAYDEWMNSPTGDDYFRKYGFIS